MHECIVELDVAQKMQKMGYDTVLRVEKDGVTFTPLYIKSDLKEDLLATELKGYTIKEELPINKWINNMKEGNWNGR